MHVGLNRPDRTNDYFSLDLTCTEGTPIVASASGKVVAAGWGGAYGNRVLLTYDYNNGNTFSSIYAHMIRLADGIATGVNVVKGQRLGDCGQTGGVTIGPHLHFALYKNMWISTNGYGIGQSVVPEPLGGQVDLARYQIFTSTTPAPSGTPAPVPASAPSPVETACTNLYTTTVALNLRASPVTGSVLVVIPAGASVTEIAVSRSVNGATWRNINYNGRTGWASGYYLTFVRSNPCTGTPLPVTPTLGSYTICGTECSRCFLTERPEILAAFPENETDTSCLNTDDIILAYCFGMEFDEAGNDMQFNITDTQSDCDSIRFGKCKDTCASFCLVNCDGYEGQVCTAGQCALESGATSYFTLSVVVFLISLFFI
jgi:uncharacterized protein YraI